MIEKLNRNKQFLIFFLYVNMDMCVCVYTYFFNMEEIFSLKWYSHSRHRDIIFKGGAVANISTYCKCHRFSLCRRTKSEYSVKY